MITNKHVLITGGGTGIGRATVSTSIKGKKTIGVFEALDLRRFRNPLLMFMLAVRVPRRKLWKNKL
jgi:hypothetical protein